ncbi:hypothetical protein FQZ97_635180 [compost metagenome]
MQVAGLLAVGGEHARQLVEDLGRGVTADPAEGLVDLDDVAGRIGDQDRRGGVFEHRGGHAQVFFRAALLADVAAHAEQALEVAVVIPHRHQAQLDRNFSAIGAQAVEDEQLRLELCAQLAHAQGAAQRRAHPLEQYRQAGQLLRVGGQAVEVVGEEPLRRMTEHRCHRRADVVEVQVVVRGEDHVAGALGQQPVTLLAVAQRFAAADLLGDVLGHSDQATDAPAGIARQGLFADAEPAPGTVAMAPAQL